MNLDWPALQRQVDPLHAWNLREIILDFSGPQIVVWNTGESDFLSVASDDESSTVRWIGVPVSTHELRSLRLGGVALLDLLTQPEVTVFDVDSNGLVSAYQPIPFTDIPADGLPEAGALLPDEIVQGYCDNEALEGDLFSVIIDGPGRGTERSVRILADVLGPFQKLLDAIGQFLEAEATSRGRVQKEVANRTSLQLEAVAVGSAVLTISSADPELHHRVLRSLQDLAISSGRDDLLSEVLGQFGPRVRSRFGDLIASVSRHQVNVVAASRQKSVLFSRHSSDRVRRSLSISESGLGDEIELVGRFVAFDTRSGRFDFFSDDDDESYKGDVSPDLLNVTDKVIVGSAARYLVRLRLKSIRPLGATQTTEYILKSIILQTE